MSASLAVQIAVGIGYVVGYVLWSRSIFYRVVDPVLRRWISRKLGVQVSWVFRRGSGGPVRFGPRYDTWTWGIPDENQRSLAKEGLVYTCWLLLVPVSAGLWPVALFLLAWLWLGLLSVGVAYPLLFLTIWIYSIFWSGRYQLAE